MQVMKNNAMTEQTGEGCPYPQISENAGMGQYDDQNFCIRVHVLVLCNSPNICTLYMYMAECTN